MAEVLGNFPAKRLKQAFAWIDQTKGMPKEVALAKDATLWLTHVDSLRDQEQELLASGGYTAALDEHRVVVSELIADGERIIFRSKKAGISNFPSGFTLSDFEAAVESLRVTLRCQHGPKNSPAVNELISKLFDVS